MDTGHLPRTKGEALLDLKYLTRLSARHRRMYHRMTGITRWLEIFGGSGALAAALSAHSGLLIAAGVLLSAVAAYNVAVDPAARAAHHYRAGEALCTLLADADQLPLAEIDARRLAIDQPDYWEALRQPSYNDAVTSAGFPSYAQPLNRWQRFAAAIA